MNRHRAYWSVMGIEPSEDNYRQERTEKLRQELKRLIDIHGKDKVTTAIRKIYEEEKQC